MKLQGAPVFSPEDYPDVPEQLLQRLTQAFDELYSAASSEKSIGEAPSKTFTSSATGTAYLDLKISKPAAVWVGKLESESGEIVTPYSQTWVATNSGIRMLFSGLDMTTKYTCTVLYR